MSPMSMLKATLSNLNGGKLEERFQAAINEIATRVFGEPDAWRMTSGRVEAKVTVTVTLSMDAKNGDVLVTSSCDSTFPKRRGTSSGIYFQINPETGEREWQVLEREPEQQSLFSRKADVKALGGGKSVE